MGFTLHVQGAEAAGTRAFSCCWLKCHCGLVLRQSSIAGAADLRRHDAEQSCSSKAQRHAGLDACVSSPCLSQLPKELSALGLKVQGCTSAAACLHARSDVLIWQAGAPADASSDVGREAAEPERWQQGAAAPGREDDEASPAIPPPPEPLSVPGSIRIMPEVGEPEAMLTRDLERWVCARAGTRDASRAVTPHVAALAALVQTLAADGHLQLALPVYGVVRSPCAAITPECACVKAAALSMCLPIPSECACLLVPASCSSGEVATRRGSWAALTSDFSKLHLAS